MNKKYQNILEKFFSFETTDDYTLEKITQACAFFGNPQNTFRSIHIAGTNGKGSVSKMIFQMLKESGKRVGVYTSPHNIDIRERFEVANCSADGLISGGDFIDYTAIVISYGGGLSYYEKCVLMAFLYFRDIGCEYAVIEVGMGGRLDATNIVTPILSVITSISYDHMDFLGNTLEAIAGEKGGIIKPGVPVILYDHNYTLESIAKVRSSRIIFPSERLPQTNLLGEHQIANARIAYEAGVFLGVEKTTIEYALMHIEHHGRLEYLIPNLLVDGAHNEDGLKKLKNYLDTESHNWQEIILCFNLKEGKSVSLVLDIFENVNDWIIIDSHGFKVSDAQMIGDEVIREGKNMKILTPEEIFSKSQENPEKLFVVFGSLYMMGEFLSR